MALVKKKGMKNTNIFEKMEALNVISSMYILITPTATKCENKSDILSSDKLLTMNSEEFLLAFQSLLEVNDKENSFSVDSCSTVVEKETEKSHKIIQTSKDFFIPAVEKSKTLLTVAVQTEELANSKKLDISHKTMFNARLASASSNAINNNSDKSFTDNEKNYLELQQKELKEVLSQAPANVKNILLQHYYEQWDKNLTSMLPIKYLNAHISLFSDFINMPELPEKAFIKLVRRYATYLKRLLSQFCRCLDCPVEVIKFDQTVLSHVRRIGAWDFRKAWYRAEDEKKENFHQKLPASDQSSHSNRNQKVNSVKNCLRKSPIEEKNTSITLQNKQRKQKAVSRSSELRPHEFLEENEPLNRSVKNICKERKVHILPLKRPYSLSPPEEKYFDQDRNDLQLRTSVASIDQLKKRFKSTRKDDEAKPIFCKFFNQGYCYKTASKCSFLHVCNVCGKTKHCGKFCPVLKNDL